LFRALPARLEGSVELKKHNHGQMFRLKMVPFTGPSEYGEWFDTESELRLAMRGTVREIGKRYYCEKKMIACGECEVDERAKVISTL
jgi:hypothetical protein